MANCNVFDKFHTYYKKILLGDFNAKLGREDIFKLTIWNESLHKISKDNGVGLVHFATSKVKVQENQVRLKLNGTHQLLAYADDVNLLGDNIDTLKKNIETLILIVGECIQLLYFRNKTQILCLYSNQIFFAYNYVHYTLAETCSKCNYTQRIFGCYRGEVFVFYL
jgi:hypothetical protein